MEGVGARFLQLWIRRLRSSYRGYLFASLGRKGAYTDSRVGVSAIRQGRESKG